MKPPRIWRKLQRVSEALPPPRLSSMYAHIFTQPTPEEGLRSRVALPQGPNSNSIETLADFAVAKRGLPFTKLYHYFHIYESQMRFLAERSRNEASQEPLRILEIGVWRGGSLDLWRQYFGPRAIIFGVDIDKSCGSIPQVSGQIRIGSQVDRVFMESVVAEMGGLDIVIDDGSHISQHVVATFKILFPLLADNGYYWIEDLHTSYWPKWGGGLRRRNSSIEFLKGLVDELHTSYFKRGPRSRLSPEEKSGLRSVEFFDSIALIRKGTVAHPELFLGGDLMS